MTMGYLGLLMPYQICLTQIVDVNWIHVHINASQKSKKHMKTMNNFRYTELQLKSPLHASENIIVLSTKNKSYHFWNKSDLSELKKLQMGKDDFLYPNGMRDSYVINVPKKEEVFLYNFANNEVLNHKTPYTLLYQKTDGTYYGLKEGLYTLLDENLNALASMKRLKTEDISYSDYGILKFSNTRTGPSYFELFDMISGQSKWRYDLEKRYMRFELFNQYLLIVEKVEAPTKVHCLNLLEEKHLWTLEGPWTPWILFDKKEESVVISFNDQYHEMDLQSGREMNSFKFNRNRLKHHPEKMALLTDNSIFFYSSLGENVMGQIDRSSGELIWDEQFLPDGCSHLNIYFWDLVQEDKHLVYIFDRENPKLLLLEMNN